MKKQLLLRLTLLALFLGLIPVSCLDRDPCPELKDHKSLATIESLEVHWQLKYLFTRIDEFTTHEWENVALDIYINDYEYVSSKERTPLTFSPTLLACSPAPPHSKEKVEGVYIISNVDFNMSQSQKYFVGDTINELFHREHYPGKTLEEAFVGSALLLESNQIFFREKPEKRIEMDIDVIVHLNNQDIYTFKNLKANLK